MIGQCIARFGSDPRMPEVRQCSRKAVGGSEYCFQHDPQQVEIRRKAADVKALKNMRRDA